MLSKNLLKKALLFCVPIIFILLFSANIVLGQDSSYGLNETAGVAGVTTNVTAPQFLGNIAGAALAIAGSIFLFLMVYGGVMILTSAGKSEQVNKGKDIIKWAIIGAIVLGAAYAITNLVFQAVSGGAK